MRIAIIILFAFLQTFSFGQDNQLKPDAWDSLHLRHQQEEEAYNARLKNEVDKIDTIKTKDSIVVRFTSKKLKPIKRIVYGLDERGCNDFIRYEYYNAKGQLAYTKRHTETCPKTRKGQQFNRLHYERFEYDEMNRLIIYIDTWADRPYRVEYKYNEDGTVSRTSKKISETYFWK